MVSDKWQNVSLECIRAYNPGAYSPRGGGDLILGSIGGNLLMQLSFSNRVIATISVKKLHYTPLLNDGLYECDRSFCMTYYED